MAADIWTGGDAYEAYVGRWSRAVAEQFVRGLAGERWLDVGCGTGALTEAIAADAWAVGIDPSENFLRAARAPRVVGSGVALPVRGDVFDVVVSGVALNFMPDPAAGVREMARVARPGGTVAAYVWDYAGGMQLMRHFWDAAAELDPRAPDEAARFPICHPAALAQAWHAAGLVDVVTGSIEVPTVFRDFDDYWRPFLGGAGAAPAYLASLAEPERLRELLRQRLPTGEIRLTATAWTVRGKKDLRAVSIPAAVVRATG